MPTVSKISASVPRVAPRKRVAAYARVSMETELLLHSLSAQVSHYSKLIQGNPGKPRMGIRRGLRRRRRDGNQHGAQG